MRDPAPEYESRLADRRQRADEERKRYRTLGNARLVFVVAAIAGVWFAAARSPDQGAAPWITGAIAFAIFLFLMIAGDRLNRRIRLAQRAVDYYERALDRVHNRRNEAGETGERFLRPEHPYAVDLDLFGKHSLFQLLSICRTRGGEARLARWLLEAAPADEIRSRHAAIGDLRDRLDLREDLAVLGEDFRSGVHPEALAQWAVSPPVPISPATRYIAAAFSLVGLSLLTALTLTLFADPRLRIAVIAVGAIEGIIFFRWRNIVNQIAHAAEEPGHDLALLSALLARLERERFVSPRLTHLHFALQTPGSASLAISSLDRIVQLLESRENWLVRLAGPLVLWTTQVSFAAELWRQRHGGSIPQWLEAVAEFEALGSLAAAAFERPDHILPEFTEEHPGLEAQGLAHPLLPDCVPNDVSLGPGRRLLIVSGSNMSGKSTLLRTLGVNVVLALAGAPVRAESLRLSVLSIGASIRTSDSLEGGISRFYAEILRLRQIIDLNPPALFLLDELLAGTNSHDRGIGAHAILQALLERNAIGLGTTHDLALSSLAGQLPDAMNVHFEDYISEGRMRFDYKMRPGVVSRSNALELMRAVGLEV